MFNFKKSGKKKRNFFVSSFSKPFNYDSNNFEYYSKNGRLNERYAPQNLIFLYVKFTKSIPSKREITFFFNTKISHFSVVFIQ